MVGLLFTFSLIKVFCCHEELDLPWGKDFSLSLPSSAIIRNQTLFFRGIFKVSPPQLPPWCVMLTCHLQSLSYCGLLCFFGQQIPLSFSHPLRKSPALLFFLEKSLPPKALTNSIYSVEKMNCVNLKLLDLLVFNTFSYIPA